MDYDDGHYHDRPTWYAGEQAVILSGLQAIECTVVHDNGLYVLVEIAGWLYAALWHYDDGVLILAPNNRLEAPVLSMQLH